MRGATGFILREIKAFLISIHAPHAGGDIQAEEAPAATEISIHAPHAGGDPVALL